MKRFLFTLALIVAALAGANAQCGDELMKQALGAMGNNQYIKDFDIKLAAATSKTGTKMSVVLNSHTKYQINVANGAKNAENVVIQIFDGDKLIGSNFFNGKVFDKFGFVCTKTGAYKLHVYCNAGGDACARAVLSLVEQMK